MQDDRDKEGYNAYIRACKQAEILAKGTSEERELLRSLYRQASHLAGRDHCMFSSQETTDEGIEESAILMSQLRILLANIRHRGESSSGKQNT